MSQTRLLMYQNGERVIVTTAENSSLGPQHLITYSSQNRLHGGTENVRAQHRHAIPLWQSLCRNTQGSWRKPHVFGLGRIDVRRKDSGG